MNNTAPAQLKDLEGIFGNVISLAIGLGGIVLFVMLILAGFNYISSAGDPQKAAAARNTATYAILGLVLLALAYLFLRLIASFTGANEILNFQISQP